MEIPSQCSVFRPVRSETPPCRVLLSFEPAIAGWVSPKELRLGRSLSRHSYKIGTRLVTVGSKPGVQHHAHSRAITLYHKTNPLSRFRLKI